MNYEDFSKNTSDAIPLPVRVDLRSAVSPLRLIFWGGLICVLHFKINEFDLLNDTLGTILIALGVFRLASFQVDVGYKKLMSFIKVVSVLAIPRSVFMQLPHLPDEVGILTGVLGLFNVVATVCFCVAMQRLCAYASYETCVKSWKTTTILFTAIYLIPLGLLNLIAIVCIVSESSFNVQLGPWALPLLVIFFVPLIHLFVSTSRMKRQAQVSIAPDASAAQPGQSPSAPGQA